MTADQIVNAYVAAWFAVDEVECRHHLEISWSEDGVYQSPEADALGREALVQHIVAFHKDFPGTKIILTSGVAHHHDKIHFLWKVVSPEGETLLDGRDFGEIGLDGRLGHITSFFDPPPLLAALPESVKRALLSR